MKFNYPHSIDNGHGEVLTFVRLVEEKDGNWVEVENSVDPGAGPPMHVHFFQDENLTVVKGKIGTQIKGEPAKFYGEGDSITFTKGQVHKFWNAGNDKLICKGWIKPADNIVYFLSEIYKSTKENGGKGPTPFDGAYLTTRYASEFGMDGLPGFVKKVIFPVLLFFGKLRGKDRKFEGAPEPRLK